MAYRVLLLAASLALIVGAFFVPVSPVEHGGYTLEGWWLAMAGVAIAMLAIAAGTRWLGAAALTALLVLGVAGQLTLIQQHWLQYFELRPGSLASGLRPLAVGVLVAQAAVVSGLLRRRWRSLWRGLAAFLTPGRAAVATLLFLLCAAHATLIFVRGFQWSYVVFYLAQLAAAAGLFALNLGCLFLAVGAMPEDALSRAWSRIQAAVSLPGAERPPTRIDRLLPGICALFVFAVAVLMAFVVLDSTPHIQDEVAYLFQARCLAAGMLTAPAPPEPAAFSYYLLTVEDGRWFGVMNPGWPLVLAVGVVAGATWLVNPLLAALTVLVTHALTRMLADRGTANLVALLLSVSPWFLLISGSLMGQVLSLLLALCAFLLALRAARRKSWLAAFAGGLCLGLLFLNRPLDALVVAAGIGIWCLGLGGLRLRTKGLLAMAAGGLLSSAWVFPYNAHITGDPLVVPMNHYFDKIWYPGANRLGFGADVGNPVPRWTGLDPLPGHGPADVLLNANQNLYNTNFELFGWAVGSLLLVAVFVLRGHWSRLDLGLGGFTLAILAAYSLYWFSGGPDYGARYWFLILYPLLWLTARGAATCGDVLRGRFPHVAWEPRLAAAIALLILLSLTTFLPWRMVAKYPDYRHAYADVRRLLESGAFDRGLVLVQTASDVEFGPALVLNDPRLAGDGPVVARDLGPESVQRLREHFDDRPVYRVEGRFVSGKPTRIVSGPEPPGVAH